MNKNFVASMAGSSILLLTMCSSSLAFGEEDHQTNIASVSESKDVLDVAIEKTMEEKFVEAMYLQQMSKIMEEKALQEKLTHNSIIMESALSELKTYAGKTRYVFAGSTPRGWDCSGLVLWFYSHFDVELYHSATEQMKSGTEVIDPKPGDIVSFQWKNSTRAYHVGIYVDDNTMIDAGSSRSGTRFRTIDDFGGSNSVVKYIRIVETN